MVGFQECQRIEKLLFNGNRINVQDDEKYLEWNSSGNGCIL